MSPLDVEIIEPNKIMVHRKFKNLDDVLNQAAKNHCQFPEIRRQSKKLDDPKWSGTKDFKQAWDYASMGWPEGFKELTARFKQYQKIFEDILPAQDFGKDLQHKVEGEFVDVARAIEGEPEAMMTHVESEDKIKVTGGNKLQRLIINGAFNCTITPETLFAWGAMGVILAQQMEMHGFSTEIVIRVGLYGGGWGGEHTKAVVYDIPIKQFVEFPDFNKLSFALAHVSFLRRMMFAIMEQEPEQVCREFGIPGGGYGMPGDNKIGLEKNDLYIPIVDTNYSVETIIQKFREMVAVHFDVVILDYRDVKHQQGSELAHKPKSADEVSDDELPEL